MALIGKKKRKTKKTVSKEQIVPNGQDNMEIVDQILEEAKENAEEAIEKLDETAIVTPIDEEEVAKQIEQIIKESKIPEMKGENTTDPKVWDKKVDEQLEKVNEIKENLQKRLDNVEKKISKTKENSKDKKTNSKLFNYMWNGTSDAWFN